MHKKTNLIVMMGALLVAATLAVRAQDPAPADGPGYREPPTKTLLDYWKVGGPTMYPIALCSVVAIAFTIYCGIQYTEKKMIRPDLLPVLRDSLGKLDVPGTLSICNGNPSILTNLLAAGLNRIGESGVVDVPAMEKAMEEASVEEVAAGMKPLNYISIASQIAPMLGLLGTVTGMIGAFNKIGMGKMGDPEALASNIGEAMITTAAGLMVAIPAMFAYFALKGVYIANVSRISRVLGDMLHHLAESTLRQEA
ncbi:MAG: MotA/TolQ/ExbB proton channel family protein [Kiritimatiellia bacterium]|jgi:biopolymer transport protein ExbB